jgi:hypothetical protein
MADSRFAGRSSRNSGRAAWALAIAASAMLFWLSLGVGLIGRDGDPANRMYLGVLLVGVVGALFARLQARGMVRTLVVMALAQTGIGVFAVLAGLGLPWSGPAEILGLTLFFVALFSASAWLFSRAAAGGMSSDIQPARDM